MATIVSLGSALQDIYLVDRDDFAASAIGDSSIFGKLIIGTKVDIDRISYQVGGGGTNSAVTFARHGHQAIFLGNLGNDPAADAILSALDQENVDTSLVCHIPRVGTGCSTILLDSKTGERTILTYRGASADFSSLKESDLALVKPDWLYVSTVRGDVETLERFFIQAKKLGTKIMYNPGLLEIKRGPSFTKLLRHVDILLVNKLEAMEIVPGKVLPELLSRLKNYVNTVIITAGVIGGIAVNGTDSYRFGLYEDVKVKDTTGAGDAFGSGFLAHYAAGHSFRSSLIFASANSTSVISKLGAKNGILTGEEDLHPMAITKEEYGSTT